MAGVLFQARFNEAKEMLKVQGEDGTWNYDEYMHGMYNGMEYIVAMMEDREPVYREAPKEWLKDKPQPEPKKFEWNIGK